MANFPIENRVKLTYNMDEVIDMAEFCLNCWNEINETNDPADKYVISKELDFCEGCGEWTNVIVRVRKTYELREFIRSFSARKRKKKA